MAIGAVGIPGVAWVPPVGMILTTGSSASPAAAYPGTTWTQLKDRFLIGAGGSYSLGSTGGASTHTPTTAQMPAPKHSGSITSAGSHTHTLSITGGTSIRTQVCSGGANHLFTYVTVSFGSAGAHTHSVTIGNAGSGTAFSIMNPYIGKFMWKRVG